MPTKRQPVCRKVSYPSTQHPPDPAKKPDPGVLVSHYFSHFILIPSPILCSLPVVGAEGDEGEVVAAVEGAGEEVAEAVTHCHWLRHCLA